MRAVIVACIAIALVLSGSAVDAFTGRFCRRRPVVTLFGIRSDKLSNKEQQDLCEANALYFDGEHHQIKHITSNTWPRSSFGRKLKKRTARPYLHGVEIRQVQAPHPLAGQLGLFAANPFHQYDVVGEYCGQVFDKDDGGEYATYLESRDEKYALGVDARREGNECRFINHYQGIAQEPNVVMKIAYVEELPRVIIVCMKNIQVGQELLLQYSADYVEEYIVNTRNEGSTG